MGRSCSPNGRRRECLHNVNRNNVTGKNGEWRRFHNEELCNLYPSPIIVKVIKSKRLRWAGHVARMEEGRSAFNILTGTLTGKRLRCR